MNFNTTISASALLYNIIGDEDDFPDNFYNDDLSASREWGYDLEEEEEEEVPRRDPVPEVQYDGNGKPRGPFVPKVAGMFMFSTCNDFECPVCMEPYHESESGVYELPCGHKYCKSCTQSYVNFYAGENLPLNHKVSVVTYEGPVLSVTRGEINGVTCPNRSCRKPFSDEHFGKLLDEKSLKRYFEIRDAQFRRVKDEAFRSSQLLGDRMLVSWSRAHQDIVRLCPYCYTQIEKNGGCENMVCTKCFKHFTWPHALRVGTKGHWLNGVMAPSTSSSGNGNGKGKNLNNRV